MTKLEIVSLNVAAEKGTSKRPVEEIVVDGLGIVGDVHRGRWHRQLSLLDQESVDHFAGALG
jgi:cyclic pyranopterin phosphate synthase